MDKTRLKNENLQDIKPSRTADREKGYQTLIITMGIIVSRILSLINKFTIYLS